MAIVESIAACKVESPELVPPSPAERSSEDLLVKGKSKVGRLLQGPAAYYTPGNPVLHQGMAEICHASETF